MVSGTTAVALISYNDINNSNFTGTVTTPTLALDSLNGNIGVVSGTPTAFNTNATTLTAQALNGSVYVSDSATANVALANASINNGVTTFSLVNSANTASGTYSVIAANSATTNLTTAINNNVAGNNVILESSAGGLSLAGNINGTTSVALISYKDINNSNFTGTVTTPTLALDSINGSIGVVSGTPTAFNTNTTTLTAQALNGSVYVSDSAIANVALTNASINNGVTTFNLTNSALNTYSVIAANSATTNLTTAINNNVAAANVILESSAGGLSLAGNVNGTTSVALISYNDINNANFTGTVTTPILALDSINGNIGVVSGTPTAFNTNATTLTAQALNGSVYVSDGATGTVTLANTSINNGVTTFDLTNSANTVSGTYSVTAANALINLDSNINANLVNLTAGNGIISYPQLLTNVITGINPIGAQFNNNDSQVWVSSLNSSIVTVINPLTNVATSINTGVNSSHNIAFSPNDAYAYIASYYSGDVIVVKTSNDTVTNVIGTGGNLAGIAVNPINGNIYVSNFGSNDVIVINPVTFATITTINTGNPNQLAVANGGQFIYATNVSTNTVSVISTSTNTVVDTISSALFNGPTGISINPASNMAYVTNISSNTVTEVNLLNNTAVANITVGSGPEGISFNPSGSYAYVTNQNSNSVSIINTALNKVVDTISVGNDPDSRGIIAGIVNGVTTAYVDIRGSNYTTVLATPTIFATTANLLSTTGTINVDTTATNLTANTSGANSNVLITDTNGSNVNLSNSSAGNIFQLGSNGSITINGNVTAPTQINLNATNIIETSGTLTANAIGSSSILLTASGTTGIGSCSNPLLINTPNLTAIALNGSAVINDSIAVTVNGNSAVNAISGYFELTDSSSSNPAITLANGVNINGNTIILNASNGGLSLTSGNLTASIVELIANTSIINSTISTISGENTLVVDSTGGSIGVNSTTPLLISVPNFSATAPTGSVYVQDTYAGNITVINPLSVPCGPVLAGANSSASNYFIQSTNTNSTSLLTASGVTVSANNVVLASVNGSIGTVTTAFSSSTNNLTANSISGSVFVLDSNGVGGVNLVNNSYLSNSYTNSAATGYSLQETGSGGISLTNTVNVTSANANVVLQTSLGNIENAIGFSPVIISGSNGSAILTANGSTGIGSISSVINVNSANLSLQALNGSIYISDSNTGNVNIASASYVFNGTPFSVVNSALNTYSVIATNSATTNLTTAINNNVAGNNVILESSAGGLSLAGNVNGTTSVALISYNDINNANFTGTVTTPTLALDSLNGNIGVVSGTPTAFNTNATTLTAQALNGSVYVSDSATANVALANASINNGVTTFNLTNSANTVGGTYSVIAVNSATTNLTTALNNNVSGNNVILESSAGGLSLAGNVNGTTAVALISYNDINNSNFTGTVTTPTLALDSINGNIGVVSGIPTAFNTNATTLTSQALNGSVYVSDSATANVALANASINNGVTIFNLTNSALNSFNVGTNAATSLTNAGVNGSTISANVVILTATNSANTATVNLGNAVNGKVSAAIISSGSILNSTLNNHLTAPAIALDPLNGSVGTLASPITTGATTLSAQANSGNVYVLDTATGIGTVTVNLANQSVASANGNIYNVGNGANTTTGTYNVGTNAATSLTNAGINGSTITANAVVITATNAANTATVNLGNAVNGTTSAAVISSGSISNTSLNNHLTAPAVALDSLNGSVGTLTSPIATAATTLSAQAVNGNVYVLDTATGTGAVTVNLNNQSIASVNGTTYTVGNGANTTSGIYNVATNGATSLTNAGVNGSTISANAVILTATNTANTATVNLGNAVNGTTSAAVISSGSILNSTLNGNLTAPAVAFLTLNGNIGSVNSPLKTNAIFVSADPPASEENENGSVYVIDNAAKNITLLTQFVNSSNGTVYEVNNDASSTSGIYNFASTIAPNLIIQSPITGNQVVLVATNPTDTASINLNAQVSATSSVGFISSGSIFNTSLNNNLLAQSVALDSLSGSVGTLANPITMAASTLSAQAINGSVYVLDSSVTNVMLSNQTMDSVNGTNYIVGNGANTATGIYNVASNAATSLTNTSVITANEIVLVATNTTNNAIVNLGASINGTTSAAIVSSGSISNTTLNNYLLAPTIALDSLNGSVGTQSSPVNTTAAALTFQAINGSVYALDTNINSVNLASQTVASSNGITYVLNNAANSTNGTYNVATTQANSLTNTTLISSGSIVLAATNSTNSAQYVIAAPITAANTLAIIASQNITSSSPLNIISSKLTGVDSLGGSIGTLKNPLSTISTNIALNSPKGSDYVLDISNQPVGLTTTKVFSVNGNNYLIGNIASPLNGTYNLATTLAPTLSVNSPLSANNLVLVATNPSDTAIINLNAQVTTANASIISSGSIGNNTLNNNLDTTTIALDSLNGSVGSLSNPITTTATNIAANAATGSSYFSIASPGSVNLVNVNSESTNGNSYTIGNSNIIVNGGGQNGGNTAGLSTDGSLINTDKTRALFYPLSSLMQSALLCMPAAALNPASAPGVYIVCTKINQPFYFENDPRTIVLGTTGTVFTPNADNTITLKTGKILALAGDNDLKVISGNMVSILPAHSSAIIVNNDNQSRVAALTGASIKAVLVKPINELVIPKGKELVVASNKVNEDVILDKTSGINRQLLSKQEFPELGLVVVQASFDRASLANAVALQMWNLNCFTGNILQRVTEFKNELNTPITGFNQTNPNMPFTSFINSSGNKVTALINHPNQNNSIELVAYSSVKQINSTNIDSLHNLKFAGGNLIYNNSSTVAIDPSQSKLTLINGEILVNPAKDVIVAANNKEITVKANTIALISCKDKNTIVRNLCDNSKHGVIINHNSTDGNAKLFDLNYGTEAIITDAKTNVQDILHNEAVGRRNIKLKYLTHNQMLIHSEVSMVNLFAQSPVLEMLFEAEGHDAKTIRDRIIKMAACLQVVTTSHGFYSKM